jgi:hypothetical protein
LGFLGFLGFGVTLLQFSAMSPFEGFEPIFGAAQGQLELRTSHDELLLPPFLLCVRARDGDHLVIHVTDFHANTWHADMSTEFLEDLVHNFILQFD